MDPGIRKVSACGLALGCLLPYSLSQDKNLKLSHTLHHNIPQKSLHIFGITLQIKQKGVLLGEWCVHLWHFYFGVGEALMP